jgi:hypothetical protein
METSHATDGGQADSEINSNMQPKKKTEHMTPTVRRENSGYSLRGRDRPCMVYVMKMMVMTMMAWEETDR